MFGEPMRATWAVTVRHGNKASPTFMAAQKPRKLENTQTKRPESPVDDGRSRTADQRKTALNKRGFVMDLGGHLISPEAGEIVHFSNRLFPLLRFFAF